MLQQNVLFECIYIRHQKPPLSLSYGTYLELKSDKNIS